LKFFMCHIRSLPCLLNASASASAWQAKAEEA